MENLHQSRKKRKYIRFFRRNLCPKFDIFILAKEFEQKGRITSPVKATWTERYLPCARHYSEGFVSNNSLNLNRNAMKWVPLPSPTRTGEKEAQGGKVTCPSGSARCKPRLSGPRAEALNVGASAALGMF